MVASLIFMAGEISVKSVAMVTAAEGQAPEVQVAEGQAPEVQVAEGQAPEEQQEQEVEMH